MIKAYKVAGHTFHLSMDDSSGAWSLLSQYAPFEVPCAGDPLFTLTLVDRLSELEPEPLFIPEDPDEGQPRLELYSCKEGIVVEMAPLLRLPACARMLSCPDYSSGELQVFDDTDSSVLFAINNSLMLLFAFRSAPLMTLEMHASVISNGGKGYLFLGKSGTGKSTHSRLWLRHVEGSHLMNDDNPIVRIGDDGIARVYGSPWSGKTPCYRNENAPIGAIVRITQAPENKIFRLNTFEAYASVYSSCSGFKADREMADGQHRTLESIAVNVPCFNLHCLPDEEAARLCSSIVMKEEKHNE